MKKNLNFLLTLIFTVFLLAGCGGGGGGESAAAEFGGDAGGSSPQAPSSGSGSQTPAPGTDGGPQVKVPTQENAEVPVSASAQLTTLTVSNPLPHNRSGDPVTSGVPLPQDSGITDVSQLVLTTSEGSGVPAQFRVLSRWGALEDSSAPIKWVLVDFQADVPAASEASYLLQRGSAGAMETGLVVEDGADRINVDTGALSFTVSKERFDLLSTGANGGGIVLHRNGRTYSSALGRPDTVQIEDQGPLRTVILVRGKFYAEDGSVFAGGEARKEGEPLNRPLEYTVRLHAYAGKSYVKVDYTLENNGNGLMPYYKLNDAYIDSNYLQFGVSGDAFQVTAEGASESLGTGDSLVLSQGYQLTDNGWEPNNFRYEVNRNGGVVDSGGRAQGYFDLSGNGTGLAAGVKNFWQKHPKSLEVKNGAVRIGMLPEGGNAHYFSGGWHMTDEVLLYFHDGSADPAQTAALFDGFNNPMFARSTAEWYVDSKAWGLVAPMGTNSSDAQTAQAFDRYDQFQEMFVDPAASAEGKTIADLWETRHLNVGHYGWQRYGDLAWKVNGGGAPFSGLHYDWPFSMWLQFIRSGDERFLDLARIMTSHSADIVQMHADGQIGDGLWWWEDLSDGNGNLKSYSTAGLIFSHTWNGGYSLGYLLTGDRRLLEASDRTARGAARYWEKAIKGEKVKEDQLRSQGWSILALVNQYRITGDTALLDKALRIFENSILYTESLPQTPGSNGGGYISYNQDYNRAEYGGKVIITFATYHLEPLCELHYQAQNAGLNVASLESFLVRSLNWLRDFGYVGGDSNGSGQYAYLTLSYATDPTNPEANKGGEIAHNIHVGSAFGYGYLMMKDKDPALAEDYLGFGRHVFRDLMFYRTSSISNTRFDYHDPNSLCRIEWGWMPTATKELGYIARGGQFLMHAEYDRVN